MILAEYVLVLYIQAHTVYAAIIFASGSFLNSVAGGFSQAQQVRRINSKMLFISVGTAYSDTDPELASHRVAELMIPAPFRAHDWSNPTYFWD